MPKQGALLRRQKLFADEWLRHGNGSKAALKVYNTTNPESAKVIASTVLTNVNVKVYCQKWEDDAKKRIYELTLKAKNENVSLNAAKDILDRNIGRAKGGEDEQTNFNLTLNVNSDQAFIIAGHIAGRQKDNLSGGSEAVAGGSDNVLPSNG
jgi:hypothetical protein